jgi:hypothetical protein
MDICRVEHMLWQQIKDATDAGNQYIQHSQTVEQDKCEKSTTLKHTLVCKI